jgi:ribosome-interacting GTPase 1
MCTDVTAREGTLNELTVTRAARVVLVETPMLGKTILIMRMTSSVRAG